MSITQAQFESFWAELDFKPNAAQKAGITHSKGPLFITAGPGSGKTRVLLWRAARLISVEGVAPDRIFLATFTEKAARQLDEGLRFLLGKLSARFAKRFNPTGIYVGTLHSLCQRLLREQKLLLGGGHDSRVKVLDELAQYRIVLRNLDAFAAEVGIEDVKVFIAGYFRDGSPRSRHDATANSINFFNRMSEECLDPVEAAKKTKDKDEKRLLGLYKAYLAYVGRENLADLSLVQQKALSAVNRSRGIPEAAKFEHVIIDEYQDTNTVQEKLVFELARPSRNLCVVGDDDQALYRFRGATVENLLRFPERCKVAMGASPTEVNLSVNYRSRPAIVDTYKSFMEMQDWTNKKDRTKPFRVPGKKLSAYRKEDGPSVALTKATSREEAAGEIARFVKQLIRSKKVADPNQIAILMPSLGGKVFESMREALEGESLRVYAPRGGLFLESEEAAQSLGLIMFVLQAGHAIEPPGDPDYMDWVGRSLGEARKMLKASPPMAAFVKNAQYEINEAIRQADILTALATKAGITDETPIEVADLGRISQWKGLDEKCAVKLGSGFLRMLIRRRRDEGRSYSFKNLRRALTALDWGVLDLFYRLLAFEPFATAFAEAENAKDEGPLTNLAQVSQHLADFQDEVSAILTADALQGIVQRMLVSSYLYTLFRRGESELEDKEQSFPKGRVPILTIHQSKGLEFPVVVLGTTARANRALKPLELFTRKLTGRAEEPEDRIAGFDGARLFYVALSRAKDLVLVSHFKGKGYSTFNGFDALAANGYPRVSDLMLKDIALDLSGGKDSWRVYSYTGDYLSYQNCARQYMAFRKYGFAASRSQTLIFGSLVHRTIEDLHRLIMQRRRVAA